MTEASKNIGDIADFLISRNGFNPEVKAALPAEIAAISPDSEEVFYSSVKAIDEIRFAAEKALAAKVGIDIRNLEEILGSWEEANELGVLIESERIQFLATLGQTVLHW